MRRRGYRRIMQPWALWWYRIIRQPRSSYYRWIYYPVFLWKSKSSFQQRRQKPLTMIREERKLKEENPTTLTNIQVNTQHLSRDNDSSRRDAKKIGFFEKILQRRTANKRFYQVLEQRILDIAHKYGSIISGPRVLVEVREIDGRIVTAEDVETVIKKLVKKKYLHEIDKQLYIVPSLDLTVRELELIKLFYKHGGVLAPTDAMLELPNVFRTVDDVLEVIKKLQKKGIIINGSYERGMQFQLPAAEIKSKNEQKKNVDLSEFNSS